MQNHSKESPSFSFANHCDEALITEIFNINAFGFKVCENFSGLKTGDVEIMIVWKRNNDKFADCARSIEFEAWVTPEFAKTAKHFAYSTRIRVDDFRSDYSIRNQIVDHCMQSITFIESVRDSVIAVAEAQEDYCG